MAQTPISIKLAISTNSGIPGRSNIVQVLQARQGLGGQAIFQQQTPIYKPVQINTNTAIQYARKPQEMIGSAFLTAPLTQTFRQVVGPGVSPMPNLGGSAGLSSTEVGLLNSVQALGSSLASARKSCNCTKSHCLKLYCECFAQGQLCQNCNCHNCMNNLAYEEERGRAIKMTLERNPTAFHPKIGRGEGERRHTKGCNCKRSGCLKNYCECYEAKISCSDMCRCQGCRNTEDSIERRSLMRLSAMGSLRSRQPNFYKKHLLKPPADTLPHVFLTWEVIEATVNCLLAQAEDAERRDLPAASQERIIVEEFGRAFEHILESANKAQIRSITSGLLSNGANVGLEEEEEEEEVTNHLSGAPLRASAGMATTAAAAAAVLLRDDLAEEEEEEVGEMPDFRDFEEEEEEEEADDLLGDEEEEEETRVSSLIAGGQYRSRSHRKMDIIDQYMHRQLSMKASQLEGGTPSSTLRQHRSPSRHSRSRHFGQNARRSTDLDELL